jgi:hypothetical protein
MRQSWRLWLSRADATTSSRSERRDTGWRTRLPAAFCGCLLALVAAGCAGSSSNRVVATVGRHPITAAVLAQWPSALSVVPLAQMPVGRRTALERQALSFLIVSYWAIGQAERLGIDPSASEVAQQAARSGGAAPPDGRLRAMAELALAGIRRVALGDEPPVMPADVADYYAHNLRRFATPERREALITNRKHAAEVGALRREIARGTSFATESQPITIERLHGVRPNTLERAIYAAPLHVLIGPVKQRVDYYLFEVKRIEPASVRALAEVSGAISSQLESDAHRRALTKFARAWSRTWTARTDCSPGYVVAQCRQYRGRRPSEAALSLP